MVKSYDNKIPVLWGGRHATLLPEQTAENNLIDMVVIGQGERTVVHLAIQLATDGSLHDVEGLVFKKNTEIFINKERPIARAEDLEGFDFDLIDIENYINPETRAFAYFSSFGCPNRCGFCANSYLKRRWMSIGTKRILDDLSMLTKKFNFKNLIFQDSNFFANKSRVLAIAQGMIDSKLNLRWKASARTDQLWKYSKSELELIVRSGLVSLFIGVESGSDRMLEIMTKDSNTQEAEKTVKCLLGLKVDLHASLIFGLPGETVEDLDATIKHVAALKRINSKISFQQCFYSPFPGNALYHDAITKGWQPPDVLEEWAKIKEQTVFEIPVWLDEKLSKEYERKFKKAFENSTKTKFIKKGD